MDIESVEVLIIGRGIAAYTAALYTGRASLHPVVLRGPQLDQLSMTTVVENFPGWPDGIQGPELITNVEKQAAKFGAIYVNELAETFTPKGDVYEVTTKVKTYHAKTVIIATGASARWLGVPGEDKYIGRGMSTCATCDAAFYRGKKVIVVGGGDSAMEDSLVLTKFASHVTIAHRRDSFNASKIMQDRVMKTTDMIDIKWNTAIEEVVGDGNVVTGVKLKDTKTGEITDFACDGVFLAIGHVTNTKMFAGHVNMDEQGYIITDKLQQTNLPGVFAAGDCQDPVFRQAITSAGTGCEAAMKAEKYLEHLKAQQ